MKLNQRVAMDLVKTDMEGSHGKIIAAGPITLQPNSRAFRVVMMTWSTGSFSVHKEFFEVEGKVPDLAVACQSAKSFIDDGEYFQSTQIGTAMLCFAEKVQEGFECVLSVYRDVEV